jgi:hypothetical protein
MALVEEFENDHPVAQYLGTIDASNANAQRGLEQHWAAPVSVPLYLMIRMSVWICVETSSADPC